jgi:hypothetical protein
MRTLLIFTLLLSGTTSFAQLTVQNAVLATAGKSVFNGLFVIDFTFGETLTATVPLGSNYLITQGFQQPFKKKVTGIIEPIVYVEELSSLGYDIYPNPFDEELIVRINENESPFIQLYDNSGRIVFYSKLSGIQTTIDLSHLAPANYQLVLSGSDGVIGRISLIKSH